MSTLSVPELQFPLKIPAISQLKQAYSPEFVVQGIPWKVYVCKNHSCDEELVQSLFIFLVCAKQDNSSNWSHIASADFKLKSFNESQSPVIRDMSPGVFTPKNGTFGADIIEWNSLFEPKNGYVKDDTIMLDIRIKVVAPNDPKSSRLIFEKINGCCEEASLATYRLTVENVDALMAVKSSLFIQQNMPCEFLINKRAKQNGKCILGVVMYVKDTDNKGNKKISATFCTINFKLFSKTTASKEQSRRKFMKSCGLIYTTEFIDWDELFDPQNGFLYGNAIVIEVEVKFSEVKEVIPVAVKRQTAATQTEEKRPRFECSICKEDIDSQGSSLTTCGHLFCTACIEVAVRARKLCPICNRRITAKSLRRAFLSSVDDD